MDSAVIWIWAVLSAPFMTAYAVSAANRAELDGAIVRIGPIALSVIVLIAALTVATANSPETALRNVIFCTALAYLAAHDLRSLSIPVWPIPILALIGVGFAALEQALLEHVLAAVAGYGAFAALNAGYRSMRGRDGLGEGDALVAGVLGVWLGPSLLAFSVAAGGLIGIGAALAMRRHQTALPFVPALAVGAAIVLAWRGVSSW